MTDEKRLIDANAVIQALTNITFAGWGDDVPYLRQWWALAVKIKDNFIKAIEKAPTVEVVEAADMREFAEDVVYQFGYYCQNGGRLHITHGGLSTLEHAFDILGWENPHPVPECECEIDGCHEHATCGTPTADGYKRMCGMHYRNNCAKMDGDGDG